MSLTGESSVREPAGGGGDGEGGGDVINLLT
jgi:hypothetical protein